MRPDCGERKVAPVDPEAAAKVRAANLEPFKQSMMSADASGCLTPLKIVAHSVGELCMLCGAKEPSGLMLSGFELTAQQGGEFDGVECLRLKDFGASNNGDKACELSLGNPCQRDASGHHKIHANCNDPLCLVKLFKFCVRVHLLPALQEAGAQDCAFFVRRAPQKVLHVRFGKGLACESGLHRNDKWGGGYFPKMIKELAILCGFNDAENCTMRSNRCTGTSKLASAKLGTANVQKAACHASVDAAALHCQEDEADHVARAQVFNSFLHVEDPKKKASHGKKKRASVPIAV